MQATLSFESCYVREHSGIRVVCSSEDAHISGNLARDLMIQLERFR